jgi:hypothetical protein
VVVSRERVLLLASVAALAAGKSATISLDGITLTDEEGQEVRS